jgi:phage/plasmid-associated DNA primase
MESMIEKMLGPDYAIKLPTSLITGKRTQSSAACPELSRAGNGVRFAVIQEPDASDKINNGLFKELSGNDTMYNRDLFSKGEDIQLDFKLFIVCNQPPSIQGDKATWSRLEIIPFESVFSDDAPVSYEEQLCQKVFPKDPYFSEKIPMLLKPLLWMLLNRRKKGLKFFIPAKVKIATESYRMRNDLFKHFVTNRIRDDEKSCVNQTEICQVFNEWMKEEYPGKPLPEKQDIKDYFAKLWGPVDNRNNWHGHKCLTFMEEIETGEAFLIPK